MSYLNIARSVVVRPDWCNHAETDHRACYRTRSNGTACIVLQCAECGGEVRTVARAETELRTAAQGQLFDEDRSREYREDYNAKHERWLEHQRQERTAERELTDAAWWEDYDRYRQTPEWQERRRLCLERDEHQCQAKLPGCLRRATQAHHLTYTHCGNEPLFELISVCRPCHERITAMDRARRGAA